MKAPPVRPIPAGRHCATDDLGYGSVSEWWRDHRGRVPIQAAAALDRHIRSRGCTFGEAFAALSGRGGPIVLIERSDDVPRRDMPG